MFLFHPGKSASLPNTQIRDLIGNQSVELVTFGRNRAESNHAAEASAVIPTMKKSEQ